MTENIVLVDVFVPSFLFVIFFNLFIQKYSILMNYFTISPSAPFQTILGTKFNVEYMFKAI